MRDEMNKNDYASTSHSKIFSLIGAGPWACKLAKSFSEHVRIKSVVTTGNESNLVKIRKVVPDINVCNIKDVLADAEIDAVIIATSIESLGNIAIECLQSKKHVFLEKPGASNSKQIKQIRDVKGDKVCLVNYSYLADPSYLRLKQAISNKRITSASFVWHKWGTFNNDIIMNLFSHDAAMLVDCFGVTPIKKYAKTGEDFCKMQLDCGSFVANINIDRKKEKKLKMVTFKSLSKSFIWQPECKDLIDLQRNKFLKHISVNDGYDNLHLASDVLSLIEKAR
jgi:predicted dehydrogenase